ncbi:hypothetical protein Tco_0882931, partial [Tanacetum coccineum]
LYRSKEGIELTPHGVSLELLSHRDRARRIVNHVCYRMILMDHHERLVFLVILQNLEKCLEIILVLVLMEYLMMEHLSQKKLTQENRLKPQLLEHQLLELERQQLMEE